MRLELGEGRLEAVGHLLHHLQRASRKEWLHDARLGGEDRPENLVGDFTAFRRKVDVLLLVAARNEFHEPVFDAFADYGVERGPRKVPVVAKLRLATSRRKALIQVAVARSLPPRSASAMFS